MRLVLLLIAVAMLAACEQRMANQSRYETLSVRGDPSVPVVGRKPVPGAVTRGNEESSVLSGFNRRDLESGQQHYAIFCAPCHGLAGYGDGLVVQRGFPAPPSFHEMPVTGMSIEQFYAVISHGKGKMVSYANRLSPSQRWNTAAYLTVLQRSQNVPKKALSAAQLQRLEDVK